jgi:hypothetical protein
MIFNMISSNTPASIGSVGRYRSMLLFPIIRDKGIETGTMKTIRRRNLSREVKASHKIRRMNGIAER